jgi:methionyl-tRNA formyltransferase
MRIVFLGANKIGYKCCKFIIEKNIADIVGILTIPKIFNISYSNTPVKNYLYKNFHIFESKYGIPVIEVTKKMNQYQDTIKILKPDFILVIGWYYMVPKSIRDLAPLGCAGIHASLLPNYRGGAPLVWSIINGEKKTGVTFFYLSDGVDNGDIIAQEEFIITKRDNINKILNKAEKASINILKNYLPLIAEGKAPRIQQNNSLATIYPQRKPEDGKIDWSKSIFEIYNFIRAITKPYPGAFTFIENEKIIIWKAQPYDTKIVYPDRVVGEIIKIFSNGNFIVNCHSGLLLVTEYEGNVKVGSILK